MKQVSILLTMLALCAPIVSAQTTTIQSNDDMQLYLPAIIAAVKAASAPSPVPPPSTAGYVKKPMQKLYPPGGAPNSGVNTSLSGYPSCNSQNNCQ